MSRTPDAVNRIPSQVSLATFVLLCACFVLSGIAALVYQTAWMRQFAIVFGTSELAVATVLAAYMGGLALGAVLAERFLPRVTRPVLTYALLEIGIAGSAVFLVPLLLWIANFALQSLFGGQDSPPDSDHTATTLFYLCSAFVALALPTTLMGATLPMLARYAVAEEAQIGRRIGMLYAMNTAGAVAGALLAAFVLLPALGLMRTIWVGAALNFIVFLLAIALARRVPYEKPAEGYSLDAPAPPPSVPMPRSRIHTFKSFPGPAWVLPLMLLAGAVAFFQEVLWARMLSHVVGSSIYAFGVMIASFLTGIALGGAVGAAIARKRERAALGLGFALIVAAAGAAIAYLHLESLLPETAGLLARPQEYFGFLYLPNTLFGGLLLLPMTIAIGITYPLAVRVLASDAADAAPASARVYAWNTVGAIVGSLAAGFVLIPALKYEGAIRVAVFASATLGVLALWILIPVHRVIAAVASVLAVGCLFFVPQAPMKLLLTSPLKVGALGRVLYYDIGLSASVVVLAQDGALALRTNGLPEAIMDSPGSLPRFSGEYWLSPLPVIARPKARDMLIVGFGGGVVVEGVPPTIRKIDVIELEQKVIDAIVRTSALRKLNPLTDPRLNIIVNDARGALRLTNRRYDVIVSQPSHPWTAGASHLYTREFMQLAHDHLTPDGIFVQWMNVMFLDEELLRSLTATLLSVFPELRVYRPDINTVVFLASDAAIEPEILLATTGMPLRDAPLHYARFGINSVEDLIAALVLDANGVRRFAAGSPLITDDDNRIATSSVFENARGLTADASGRIFAAQDPMQRADSIVYGSLRDRLSFPYLVRRNSVFVPLDPSLSDRIGQVGQLLGPGPSREYARAFYYLTKRKPEQFTERLRIAIEEYPDDQTLRQEYLRGWLDALARDQAPPGIAEVAAKLTGPGATVLAAARHAAKSQWSQVAATDEQLSQIPWTDIWYAEALELRVNWRTLVASPEHRKRLAAEAHMMIDRLASMNPTLSLYGQRTRAGLAAERPDVVGESVFHYARQAKGMVQTNLRTAESFRDDVKSLLAILDNAGKLPGADPVRLAEVREEVEKFAGRQ